MFIDDSDIHAFIDRAMKDVQNASMKIVDVQCPRCSHPVRFPVIARKDDVDAFKHLLRATTDVNVSRSEVEYLLAQVRKRAIERALKDVDKDADKK